MNALPTPGAGAGPLTGREFGMVALALLAIAALTLLYAVLFDQGSLTMGQNLFHEVFHDARHLLGIPCH